MANSKNQLFLSIFMMAMLLIYSCKHDKVCPALSCNGGTLNVETCLCDCDNGFSGMNCQNEDLCITQEITCLNGGVCLDGNCDCPVGFMGEHCETFDLTFIQELLEAGITPMELYQAGTTLEMLYGKAYGGGLICYMDTTDGTGVIASPRNILGWHKWGKAEYDTEAPNVTSDPPASGPEEVIGARIGDGRRNTEIIAETENEATMGSTSASEKCLDYSIDGFDDWYLPSRGELYLVHKNIISRGFGNYESGFYWTSTEKNSNYAWFEFLPSSDWLPFEKHKFFNNNRVLAIRYF